MKFDVEGMIGGMLRDSVLGGGTSLFTGKKRKKRKGILGGGVLTTLGLAGIAYAVGRSQGGSADSGGVIPALNNAPVPPPPPTFSGVPNKNAPPPPLYGPNPGAYNPPPPPISGPIPPPPHPAAFAPPAPAVLQFDPMRMLQVMIAAAHADHQLSDDERAHILQNARALNLNAEQSRLLAQELSNPRSIPEIADGVTGPQEARQLYAAALLSIEEDTPQEERFLQRLADRLRLSDEAVAELRASLLPEA